MNDEHLARLWVRKLFTYITIFLSLFAFFCFDHSFQFEFTGGANAWRPKNSFICIKDSPVEHDHLSEKYFKSGTQKYAMRKNADPQKTSGRPTEVSQMGKTHAKETKNTKACHCVTLGEAAFQSIVLFSLSRGLHCGWHCQSGGICESTKTQHTVGANKKNETKE